MEIETIITPSPRHVTEQCGKLGLIATAYLGQSYTAHVYLTDVKVFLGKTKLAGGADLPEPVFDAFRAAIASLGSAWAAQG